MSAIADVPVEHPGGFPRDGNEILRLLGRDGVIQGVTRGDGADQDQHDEPDALLTIIGAVGKAHPGAREQDILGRVPTRARSSERSSAHLSCVRLEDCCAFRLR